MRPQEPPDRGLEAVAARPAPARRSVAGLTETVDFAGPGSPGRPREFTPEPAIADGRGAVPDGRDHPAGAEPAAGPGAPLPRDLRDPARLAARGPPGDRRDDHGRQRPGRRGARCRRRPALRPSTPDDGPAQGPGARHGRADRRRGGGDLLPRDAAVFAPGRRDVGAARDEEPRAVRRRPDRHLRGGHPEEPPPRGADRRPARPPAVRDPAGPLPGSSRGDGGAGAVDHAPRPAQLRRAVPRDPGRRVRLPGRGTLTGCVGRSPTPVGSGRIASGSGSAPAGWARSTWPSTGS